MYTVWYIPPWSRVLHYHDIFHFVRCFLFMWVWQSDLTIFSPHTSSSVSYVMCDYPFVPIDLTALWVFSYLSLKFFVEFEDSNLWDMMLHHWTSGSRCLKLLHHWTSGSRCLKQTYWLHCQGSSRPYPRDTVPYPRRPKSSITPLWKPQKLPLLNFFSWYFHVCVVEGSPCMCWKCSCR